jgi:hypothetical protein
MNGQYTPITLVFRPPYRGRYGAIIERLFGNFADRVRGFLPGAIQTGQPHAYTNAVKSAALRYDDLNRFLHEIILHYQHSPHRGLHGMSPHEKWQQGLQLGLPLVPRLTPSIQRLFWRMDPRPRPITRQGICAFGMHYTSPALSAAARVNRQGQTIRYTIRYNPDDISLLAVFQEGHWIGDVYAKELRLPDGSTQPLSVAERKLAFQTARQVQQPARDWLRFTHYWQQLGQLREQERREASNLQPIPDCTPVSPADYDTHYTDLISRFTKS